MAKIYITGDCHGDFKKIEMFCAQYTTSFEDVMIILGDVGINFGFGIDEQHCTGWFFEDYTVSTSYVFHGVVRGKNNTGGAAP